mgnify:CR=1 FL=1
MKSTKTFFDNKKSFSRLLKFAGLITGAVILILIVYIASILYTPLLETDQEFRIHTGLSLQQIAKLLEDKEVIEDSQKFVLAVKIRGLTTDLKAGYYKFNGLENYSQLINMLVKNRQHTIKITIPEGSTIRDIAEIIEPYFEFTDSSFIAATQGQKLLDRLDLDVKSAEGYLFPDTYYFYPDAEPREIINKMITTLFNKLDGRLRQGIDSSDYSLHEILTMASIVEGECIFDRERPLVASLYYNRLNRRMHLNADPTIQYIISDGPRRILHKDLKIDSPYNTYRNYGLPPGPVNNPGLKSIEAAIDPADTNYLYMVAKGNGEHAFSRSYNKFLDNKREFQKYRQKVNKQ